MKVPRTLFGSLVCLAISAFASGQVFATNLIQNPGFETGNLSSWTVLNAAFAVGADVRNTDNGPSASGTHSVYMSNFVSSVNLALQQSTPNASVTPGSVNYSFNLKDRFSSNGGTVAIHIWDIDSSGGIIDQGPGVLQSAVADGIWHTFSGSFTAPGNVDHLEIEFDATFAEYLSVDNVSLTMVPEPSTFLLTALSALSLFAFFRCCRT